MNPYASMNDRSNDPNFKRIVRMTVDWRTGQRSYNEVYYPIDAVIEDVAIPQREATAPAPIPARRPAVTIDPAKLAAAQAWADEMRRALTTDEA